MMYDNNLVPYLVSIESRKHDWRECYLCSGVFGMRAMLDHLRIPVVTSRAECMERVKGVLYANGDGLHLLRLTTVVESYGGGWKFYYVRDWIRWVNSLPQRLCAHCSRRMKLWKRFEHGRFCSERCLRGYMRFLNKTEKENQCLRNGRKLLKRIKELCREPEKLQELSQSRKEESKRAASSRG
jgi:hypothetical protein